MSRNYRPRQLWLSGFFVLCVGLLMSCTDPNATSPSATGNGSDAEKFLSDAEKRLLDLNIKAGRAEWVKSTFVNDDTGNLVRLNRQLFDIGDQIDDGAGLNRLGVTPRDMITILQAIKIAGALQAEIETL